MPGKGSMSSLPRCRIQVQRLEKPGLHLLPEQRAPSALHDQRIQRSCRKVCLSPPIPSTPALPLSLQAYPYLSLTDFFGTITICIFCTIKIYHTIYIYIYIYIYVAAITDCILHYYNYRNLLLLFSNIYIADSYIFIVYF